MLDVKSLVLTTLKAASSVTALVPSARITISWPTTTSTFPCITATVLDNPSTDAYDNVAKAEEPQVEVHIFGLANTNCHPIADAVAEALEADGWWRYFCYDVVDPDVKVPHWVLRFSNKFFV